MLSSTTSSSFKARHLVCLDLLRTEQAAEGAWSDNSFARRIHACRRLLTYGRTVGWKITHVFEHTARARRSWAIEGLEPLQIEPVLYRTGVSAFSNRMFRERVEAASEAELILVSLSLSPTCLATALAARDRGVAVALVEDTLTGSPGAAAGLDAIRTLSHSIAAPFVRITRTEALIDARRGLRVVT
ncbi:MAG TPA: isochorismatase family protein [Caulobacteraceae bacterium]|jgi:nicotinamidase-related amidase|nr:isochorismatase family protein [Caulobacteraceae bacterium]